jgi:hypothetical protein
MLPFLVPVLFTFYIQGVLILKKNSGAKGLNITQSLRSLVNIFFPPSEQNRQTDRCTIEIDTAEHPETLVRIHKVTWHRTTEGCNQKYFQITGEFFELK